MSSTTPTSTPAPQQCYWLPPVNPEDLPLLRRRVRPLDVPAGYRIAVNGFGLELVAHPKWPTHPFNRYCGGRTAPNEVLRSVATLVMADFDPERDPLAWRTVEELLRVRTGRSDEQLAQMTQEDVIAALRAYRLERGNALPSGAPGGRPLQQTMAGRECGEQPTAKKESVDQRLKKFAVDNPREAIELSLEQIGAKIGCAKSAFSRSDFYKQKLRELRQDLSRRGGAREICGAEDRAADRNYAAAKTDREAIDRRLDAETARSRR